MKMDHVAIMKKSWGLTAKILSGQKRIESRWYKTRHAPWGKIKKGDTVYFKDSGEPVSVKAKVEKVLSFSGLTPQKVKQILDRYGDADGIEKNQILKNPQKVTPFAINKTGFGAMSAWLTVDDISLVL